MYLYTHVHEPYTYSIHDTDKSIHTKRGEEERDKGHFMCPVHKRWKKMGICRNIMSNQKIRNIVVKFEFPRE